MNAESDLNLYSLSDGQLRKILSRACREAHDDVANITKSTSELVGVAAGKVLSSLESLGIPKDVVDIDVLKKFVAVTYEELKDDLNDASNRDMENAKEYKELSELPLEPAVQEQLREISETEGKVALDAQKAIDLVVEEEEREKERRKVSKSVAALGEESKQRAEGYGLPNRIMIKKDGQWRSQCLYCGALDHCHHDITAGRSCPTTDKIRQGATTLVEGVNAGIVLSSLKSARNLYLETNLIDEGTFQQLADADPSPTKKYLEWMCKQYVELGADVASLSDAIALFDKLSAKNLIQQKDINSYDWSSLQQLLEEKAEAKSKTELKEEAKVEGAEEVYADDRYQVFHITSEDASILYGKGAKWCISGIRDNEFNRYTRRGVTFYFVIDHEEEEKYAVAVYPNGKKEVYNSRDTRVSKQFPFEFDFVSRPHPMVERMHQGVVATSVEDVKKILEFIGVENYTVDPETLEVDVKGNVDLSNKGLSKLPIKFRTVSGGFYCYDNQLTTLEGAPSTVGGDLYCYHNQLTSLEGAPSVVGGSFSCSDNQLTSLEGAPSVVGGSFYCYDNQLTTLEGAPSKVGGNFNCSDNPLKSFEGLGDVKGKIIGIPARLLQYKQKRRT